MKQLLTAAVLLASLAAVTAGQSGAAAGTIAFIGVHVLPMDKEVVLRDQTVIVRDGRIQQVGPAGKVQVPA